MTWQTEQHLCRGTRILTTNWYYWLLRNTRWHAIVLFSFLVDERFGRWQPSRRRTGKLIMEHAMFFFTICFCFFRTVHNMNSYHSCHTFYSSDPLWRDRCFNFSGSVHSLSTQRRAKVLVLFVVSIDYHGFPAQLLQSISRLTCHLHAARWRNSLCEFFASPCPHQY